jgi:hypothetical protein
VRRRDSEGAVSRLCTMSRSLGYSRHGVVALALASGGHGPNRVTLKWPSRSSAFTIRGPLSSPIVYFMFEPGPIKWAASFAAFYFLYCCTHSRCRLGIGKAADVFLSWVADCSVLFSPALPSLRPRNHLDVIHRRSNVARVPRRRSATPILCGHLPAL